jgi:hypothetical protein
MVVWAPEGMLYGLDGAEAVSVDGEGYGHRDSEDAAVNGSHFCDVIVGDW